MRLIDADALIEDIKSFWDWDSIDGITATTVLKQTMTDISNAPTIDAVPVVRCWECVHYYEDDGLAVCNDPGNLNGLVYENDYCSRGEREVFDATD